MGDGDDGDLRLLAQSEAKPEGAVRGEVADQDVRERLVIVGVLVLPVQALTPGTVRAGSAVLMDGVIALAFTAHIMCFRLRLFFLGSFKAPVLWVGALMVDDHKGSTTGRVRGVGCLAPCLQPLDL